VKFYHQECKVCNKYISNCEEGCEYWEDSAVCHMFEVAVGLEDHPITKLVTNNTPSFEVYHINGETYYQPDLFLNN
jgi:hypothetical protein